MGMLATDVLYSNTRKGGLKQIYPSAKPWAIQTFSEETIETL